MTLHRHFDLQNEHFVNGLSMSSLPMGHYPGSPFSKSLSISADRGTREEHHRTVSHIRQQRGHCVKSDHGRGRLPHSPEQPPPLTVMVSSSSIYPSSVLPRCLSYSFQSPPLISSSLPPPAVAAIGTRLCLAWHH